MSNIEHTRAGDAIMEKISEADHKVTESRRAVVELALKREHAFSAAELYEIVKEKAPGVGRATVFRTLDLLTSLRFLEKVHMAEGCHNYVVCGGQHHHHLICDSCGVALDFEDCSLTELLQRLTERTGFAIRGHWLEVFGKCQNCQKANLPVPTLVGSN